MIINDHGLYSHCFDGDDCYDDDEGPMDTDGVASASHYFDGSNATETDCSDCCDAVVFHQFVKISRSKTVRAYLSA